MSDYPKIRVERQCRTLTESSCPCESTASLTLALADGVIDIMRTIAHTRRMNADDHNPKGDPGYNPQSLKDVLSRDYKIPGISRHYYILIALLIAVVMVLFIWNFSWYTSDDVFIGGLFLLLAISSVAVGIQRRARRLRR